MANFRTPDGKVLRSHSTEEGNDGRMELAVIRQEALDKATEINGQLRAEVTRLRDGLEDIQFLIDSDHSIGLVQDAVEALITWEPTDG